MSDSPRDRPHLFIDGGGQAEQYRRPAQAIRTPPLPFRDRAAHADALSASIGVALEAARAQLGARTTAVSEGVPGFYLQIELPASERAGSALRLRRSRLGSRAHVRPERFDVDGRGHSHAIQQGGQRAREDARHEGPSTALAE